MTYKINYEIEFFSNWHLGSGLAISADVDAATLKDDHGLPYVPGKTLKGILKDAASLLAENAYKGIDKAFVDRIFGINDKDADAQESSLKHYQAQAYFSNAYLSEQLANWLTNENVGNQTKLFQRYSSTAIDQETGIAVDKSLRTMEVCIPVSLYGTIDNLQSEEDVEKMKLVLVAVKKMGQNRHRGLGRLELKKI